MTTDKINIRQKILFILLPIFSLALYFALLNVFYYLVYYLLVDIMHVPDKLLPKFSYFAETLVSLVQIIIFFIIYKLIFTKDNEQRRTEISVRDILKSIILGIGISGAAYLWVKLAEKIPAFHSSLAAMEEANRGIESGSKLGLIMIAVVTAPVIEEILFRGIVFRSLRKVMPTWVCIILSALIFGIYHMNATQAVYASFMGIVAAIMYEKRNNLMYPVLIHMANNFIGAAQSFITLENGVFILHIFTVIMIIPMCYIIYSLLKCNAVTDASVNKYNENIKA